MVFVSPEMSKSHAHRLVCEQTTQHDHMILYVCPNLGIHSVINYVLTHFFSDQIILHSTLQCLYIAIIIKEAVYIILIILP